MCKKEVKYKKIRDSNDVLRNELGRDESMKRRTLRVMSLLIASGLLMTGCGQTEDNGTEAAVSTEQNSGSEGLPSGTVQLTLWGAEEDQELLAQMVESFKQEYAGMADFDITIGIQSESTCKDFLLGDPEAGADVFSFVDDQLMSMVAAGVLEPVQDADRIKSENTEGAVAAASVNDTLYAYPMTADNGYFMYYNKAYFSEEDVKSLDKMMEIAAENEKKVVMDMSSGWYLYSFFGNTGMEVGLNEDGISNYCTWNSTEGDIKGVDVAEAMAAIGSNPGFSSMTDAEFIAGVEDGSVIAGVSGVWNSTAVEAAWGSDYGATKLPTYTCAGNQVQLASFAGYKMVGVNAYSKNAEWGLKLAEWITNEENQTIRFEQRGQGPSNKNAAASGAVQQSPAIQALIEQSDYASLQRIGGAYWDPVSAFGLKMAAGNSAGEDLQVLLDKMVEEVTVSNAL